MLTARKLNVTSTSSHPFFHARFNMHRPDNCSFAESSIFADYVGNTSNAKYASVLLSRIKPTRQNTPRTSDKNSSMDSNTFVFEAWRKLVSSTELTGARTASLIFLQNITQSRWVMVSWNRLPSRTRATTISLTRVIRLAHMRSTGRCWNTLCRSCGGTSSILHSRDLAISL